MTSRYLAAFSSDHLATLHDRISAVAVGHLDAIANRLEVERARFAMQVLKNRQETEEARAKEVEKARATMFGLKKQIEKRSARSLFAKRHA